MTYSLPSSHSGFPPEHKAAPLPSRIENRPWVEMFPPGLSLASHYEKKSLRRYRSCCSLKSSTLGQSVDVKEKGKMVKCPRVSWIFILKTPLQPLKTFVEHFVNGNDFSSYMARGGRCCDTFTLCTFVCVPPPLHKCSVSCNTCATYPER